MCVLARVTIAPQAANKDVAFLPDAYARHGWRTALKAPTSAASNLLPRGMHEVPAA
jgi:hypothetical protein